MKRLIKLDASETVYYTFYVEVETAEEDFLLQNLIDKAEKILYNSDVNFEDYIDDSYGFSIDRERCSDYGPTNKIIPTFINKIIRERK